MTLSFMPSAGLNSMFETDKQARRDALDPERSFLVQAPAGSGKTELLTQRLLALLSRVEKPEHVLAITFTVAATAEMRTRVMNALRKAEELLATDEHPAEHELAIAALEHSRRMGWHLLEQPRRLNIQTIDSLCLRIAHEAPLLSRLGGRLQPTEDAELLYALAARRTMEQLGGTNSELSRSLEHLLRLRDVSLGNCESLIAQMLGNRDQWLQEFSAAHSLTEDQWLALRTTREEPMRREHARVIVQIRDILQPASHQVTSLLNLLAEACGNGRFPESIAGVSGKKSLHELVEVGHLACLQSLLLTGSGTWRKKPVAAIGFQPLKDGGSREHVNRFTSILNELSQIPGLREALCDLSALPNLSFSDDEWQTIRSIFTVLRHAAAELRVVFAEHSVIDFVEAGITAEHALQNDETRRRWSDRIHHLLVDEFQDTSRRQYTLLKNIVRDWDMTENRTCFLVGDPMQSIYLFRHAELALFDEVQQHGFGADVPDLQFTHLTLTRNFRSIAGIVEPINAMFRVSQLAGDAGAARFTPALANPDSSGETALHLYSQLLVDEDEEQAAHRAEAQSAVEIIRRQLPALERAHANDEDFRIGILVRSKKHIFMLAAALREAGIPYRAVDIETLQERQEIRDLLSLMRALIHPMDRIAWLSVLRAPWCGLSLADLHILSGSDDRQLQKQPVRELIPSRIALLSKDGQLRVRRVQQTLEVALAKRFTGAFSASPHGFATWIERTWTDLGGSNCIDAGQSENVQAFFRLLATLKPAGLEASASTFDKQLEKLFAQPDPRAPEKCSVQLMTIHKAKGLGFNVVLVPRLDKTSGRKDAPLLRWLVRNQEGSDERELLIAPIGSKGSTTLPTYKWLGELRQREERDEIHRLLYVACTRARTELHLFATLKLNHSKAETELAEPSSSTLLKCGWSYLKPIAVQQWHEHLAKQSAGGLLVVPQPDAGLAIAASAEAYTQSLQRLPSSWAAAETEASNSWPEATESAERSLGRRTGSLPSRARGTVLHGLFELLASLREHHPQRNIPQSLTQWRAIATALLRQAGLHHRELEAELKIILSMLQTAARDPEAQWILGRRIHAQSESSWTIEEDGSYKVIRCDRVFFAGAEPLTEGEDHLWIVDYKTADGDNAFLLDEQQRHAPQMQRYADALREATQSGLPIRLALYYPALPHLLWWAASHC